MSRFFDRSPVFRTEEFHEACSRTAKRGSRANLLNYFVRRGRLLPVRRGIYAVVPPGSEPARFVPNRYLVLAAMRPDTVISHHTALEVLGQAHNTSHVLYACTMMSPCRSKWNKYEFRILSYPKQLRKQRTGEFGLRREEIMGAMVTVTGPERTLVDCMATPAYAGGVEEAVVSLRGFQVFDFDVLTEYLRRLGTRRVFAAVAAFLEQEARRLFVPDDFLVMLEKRRPASRTYLERSKHGGVFLKRWNLIVPRSFLRTEANVEI